jgi:Transglutaminase-like superfamily
MARNPPYRLMPHAYVCARDDYIVLMDIERGKYLAVDGRQSLELSKLIEGWPSPANRCLLPEGEENLQSGSAERIVQQLLQRKLLTDDPSMGKTAAPIKTLLPAQAFPIFALDRSLRPYLRYLPNFIMACIRARRLYRNIRLPKVVEHIQARRRGWGDLAPDAGKLRLLVRAHHHLRPLIYSCQNKCLYDSMVLLEFLAAYRMDATWVFGVHTWPWIPHCWVRAGTYLLNDSPGNIGRYSILAEF